MHAEPAAPAAIARDLAERAAREYGPEVAATLEAQIRETAEAIARLEAESFGLWSDEPDFLVAAAPREG
jgi:hypothetical protein